jgi:hypothetical protein
MAEMIHSAVWDSERFILKDGQPLHMVKLVGAIRNVCVYTKYVQIDLEDGAGLVRVILWIKEKECTAQRWMIHKCNSHHYIRVMISIFMAQKINYINAMKSINRRG